MSITNPRKLLGTCGCLALIGTFALGSLPAAASTAQNQFVKDVRYLDPDASTATNKQIVKLGNEVCSDLKSGTSVKKLAGILKGSEKAVLVEAADVLCPKYKAKVTSYYATAAAPAHPAAPAHAAAPTTPPTTAPSPRLTQQQQSAVETAKQYLSTQAFSQQGLIDQLDSSAGSGYSVNDATVAVDSLNVNWNNEAVQAAKEYLKTQPFSCTDLIQQLDSSAGDQYTVAQATYGATQAGDCAGGVPATGSTGSTGSTGNTP